MKSSQILMRVGTIVVSALMCFDGMAQYKTQGHTLTGQEQFPLASFNELPQLTKADPQEWAVVKGTQLSWGDTYTRYAKHSVPVRKPLKSILLNGWRGERVMAQAVIYTSAGVKDLNYELSDLKGRGGAVIPASGCESGFLRYVITDGIPEGAKSGCGARPDFTVFDSSMVADCIDPLLESIDLQPRETQAIWFTCQIPADVAPGLYKGTLSLKSGRNTLGVLNISIKAGENVLPAPEDWKFHLNLWQNPFAVARYYKLPLWSKEHFDAMRPIMERLAKAGQKVITTSIIDKPWNGQTEDPFKSMVTWMKKLDGSWQWSYDVFDKWVEFMISCGIDDEIDCYSMVPWHLTFKYFDQATDSMQEIKCAPGEKAYEELWVPFLKDFSAHLKQKGWFDRTTIAMDERGMEVMLKTIEVVRKASPDIKLSMAGNYHKELDKELWYYCIGIRSDFPKEVIARRRAEGMVSTYYTCCSEPHPNIFTFSTPEEGVMLGLNMAARDIDGYLRWAVISWPLEPLLDSRFRSWAAGDTYSIYPGNRSSIRFEKLLEGIQDFEKIRILRDRFKASGNDKALSELESLLLPLCDSQIDVNSLPALVKSLESVLNR